LSYQAREGWLCLWWFWAQKLEHTNRGRRELLACRRRAPRGAICRGGRPAWADQHGWLCAPPWLGFLPAKSSPLCDLCAEGPIRRTREGGSEWEPIKILLEGDADSNKTNKAYYTRLRLTTQIGQVHIASGMPLNLGTIFQPHRPENAAEHQPRVH
jgi:hypothetical protein